MVEELPWLALMFVGYAVLVLAGFNFLKQGPRIARAIAILSLAVTLSALVIVSLAMAEGVDSLHSLVWSIGLFIMLPSHAAMIFGASAVWALRAIQEGFNLADK